MEKSLPIGALTPFPEALRPEVDRLLAVALSQSRKKIVVLDDDPTGVQTVHDVNVYTDWSANSLESGFSEKDRLFFILTNSRSFTESETTAAHREIAKNILSAGKKCGRDFLLVSRGDSTLRGHYPLETAVLRQTLLEGGLPLDGEILCPYFAEGGRYTLENVHYVRMGDQLIPTGATEFARDKTFGYQHSDLRDYIEEKTAGACPAAAVTAISLSDLRALHISEITGQLLAVKNFGKVILNATDDYDVKVFCIALYRALAVGKRFCLRTAASFVRVVGGISASPLLTRAQMIRGDSSAGGIVVVGSHTQKTTAQLETLLTHPRVVPLELDSDLVLSQGALEKEAARIAAACSTLIAQGKTPVVYTKRTLLSLPGDTPVVALSRSIQISDAVQSVVSGLSVVPSFVLAKGGITSSDIGTRALHVQRARVLGQIAPGIPVWQTGPESRFPGIPYVIFPGNVGEVKTLLETVNVLLGEPLEPARQ